ncbi:MAG: peptidoglycan DD-metalloendopeptidase family protein [Candidatus Delongbacteria bacterium]|nr:peptidoglycan DD-metalloendopeptidase family protein [Candidatus Delongbacteria bacterium]
MEENTFIKNIKDTFADLTSSFSNLIFIKSKLVGLLLFACTLFNFNIAAQGIISLIVSILFARFIGIKKDDPINKLYSYNALLTGFAIGFLFKVTYLSIILTFGMSIMTVLLTYTLSSILYNYFKLPVLNIPFTISATIIYLSSSKYSNLIVDSFYKQDQYNLEFIPGYIQGLLRAAGILVFMPYDIIGIVVLLAILFYSRITFFVTILSYYTGIFFLALLKGSIPLAFAEISSFNFILVGIALGGMFLIPSKRTYLLTFTGVLVSVFIIDATSVFWVSFGIPVFTLPFNLTVLLYIYVLGSVKYPMMNQTILDKPERSLVNFLNYKNRFDWITPSINLPFMGKWTVYQGFNGEWTHKGAWKYAYDFVIEDDNSKTYKGHGSEKEDFYCFGKPIISPIDGTIIDIYDELDDNEPEQVDKDNNWGNYVIIYSQLGYYIEISHLKKDSIKVKRGDVITKGTPLAECGNSGYSPQPHLHIQLQYSPYIGYVGFEFKFNSLKLVESGQLDPDVLQKGNKVVPLATSKSISRKFQFILDEEFNYDIYENDEKASELSFKVKMESDGTYYFSDTEGNKLYFGKDKDRFVFFKYSGDKRSYLRYFMLGLPSLSLTDGENFSWEEYLPDNLLTSKLPKIFKSFCHSADKTSGRYFKTKENVIEGKISKNKQVLFDTELTLCEVKGIKDIIINTENKKIWMTKV